MITQKKGVLKMANKLEIFKSKEFGEVRTIVIDNEPYFVGKDVAEILGYANGSRDVNRHVDDEDKRGYRIGTPGGEQETIVINESGLYSLVLSSKLPQAKAFKRWITKEVLPSIRKHGMYATDELLANPEFAIEVFKALKEEREKVKALEADNSMKTVQVQIMKPKADYFDELVDRNLLTNFRETAKQLNIKQTDFVNFLISKRYIYRDKKGKLMPYADKNKGLFEVKECYNEKTAWSGTQTLITPKGRETFRLLLVG